MSLYVLRKVVTSHESLAALWALEALFSSVSSPMSLQKIKLLVRSNESKKKERTHLKFVGSCKPFTTIIPRTNKRPIARVPPQMSTQMRCLSVYFATTLVVTNVNFTLVFSNPRDLNKCFKVKHLI